MFSLAKAICLVFLSDERRLLSSRRASQQCLRIVQEEPAKHAKQKRCTEQFSAIEQPERNVRIEGGGKEEQRFEPIQQGKVAIEDGLQGPDATQQSATCGATVDQQR